MSLNYADIRRFGRRRALIHAFIVTEKGHRIACIVRNISPTGALLEVEEPHQVPEQLKLIIEVDEFEADCAIKHRLTHSVGVHFNEVRIARKGNDTRLAGPKLATLTEAAS